MGSPFKGETIRRIGKRLSEAHRCLYVDSSVMVVPHTVTSCGDVQDVLPPSPRRGDLFRPPPIVAGVWIELERGGRCQAIWDVVGAYSRYMHVVIVRSTSRACARCVRENIVGRRD